MGDVLSGLLTNEQAAEYLKVGPGTLAQWRNQGQGPRFLRLAKRAIRYRVADLDEWAAKFAVDTSDTREVAS